MATGDSAEETRVIISRVPGGLQDAESCRDAKLDGTLLRLRHPKSGNPTTYGFLGGSLQEFHWFKQPYGSWFIGNFVCEDGGLYMSTPVDPVFLLMPIFEEARMKKGNDNGKFRGLDEIMFVDGYPGYGYLAAIAEISMRVVCEVKEFGTSKFYRLNDSKVLAWLCHKVDQLKLAFQTIDRNYTAQDEKDTLTDVISLLGDYIKDEPWLKLLCDNLGLEVQEVTRKAPLSETLTFDGEDSPNAFQPMTMKNGKGNEKNGSTSRRQSKRLKPETGSLNIKDMFRKASQPKR